MITSIRFLLLLSLSLLYACGTPADDADPAAEAPGQAAVETTLPAGFALVGLQPGWNQFEPGGETICSDGSPYRFFVRPGDPEKLLFYLEGGGACWMGLNCDPTLQPSYTVNLEGYDLAQADGIFASARPDNPFADYTKVVAPYCSGDVHLGDVEQRYPVPAVEGREAREVFIHHRGRSNAQVAMDWALAALPAPREIFVTGSSAGSIPSPYYAVLLADHYPEARVIQLGDGSGGYRGFANFDPYSAWQIDRVVSDLSEMRDIDAAEFSFHHLYIAAAAQRPEIRFSAFDTAEDEVQKQFLALGGAPTERLQPLLEANLAEIADADPRFRHFVAGGDMHTILRRPELYQYASNGVRFLDWLAALARGEAVDNVFCDDCSAPELLAAP